MRAFIGVQGIYDIPLLQKNFPGYKDVCEWFILHPIIFIIIIIENCVNKHAIVALEKTHARTFNSVTRACMFVATGKIPGSKDVCKIIHIRYHFSHIKRM